jgi:cell volume regulation protein A
VFLTLGLLELNTDSSTGVLELLPMFFLQMVVGGAVGYLIARLAVVAINRVQLEYEGLYPVVLIALILFIYGAAAVVGGSGFLAVYVAGLLLGNERILHRNSLRRFADGLAWLMQIAMFLVLGLLVFPSDVWSVAGRALLVSLVLIFVARPLAVSALLALTRFGARDTVMASWVGLRGAVPIILATFPLVEGARYGELLFNVVFFIVLTSVLLQGTTIATVARWLGVDAPIEHRASYFLDVVESDGAQAGLHELALSEVAPAVDRPIVDLQLPAGTLVVLINRGGEYLVPQGATVLRAGDRLLLVADRETFDDARDRLAGPPT